MPPLRYMLGMWCSLVSAASCVALATRFALPISTTHAIVGAIVGFALAEGRGSVFWWPGVGKIFISWVASPLVAGLISSSLYWITRHFVLRNEINAMARQRTLVALVIAGIGLLLTVFIGYKFTDRGTMWDWLVFVIGIVLFGINAAVCYRWVVPGLFRHARRYDFSNDSQHLPLVDGDSNPTPAPKVSLKLDETSCDLLGETATDAASSTPTVSKGQDRRGATEALHEQAERFSCELENNFKAVQVRPSPAAQCVLDGCCFSHPRTCLGHDGVLHVLFARGE